MNRKMIYLIIAIALVAFIAIGLYNAKGLQFIQITKTVNIKATTKEVFDMVKYLNN